VKGKDGKRESMVWGSEAMLRRKKSDWGVGGLGLGVVNMV
jgi:hypothetical protein